MTAHAVAIGAAGRAPAIPGEPYRPDGHWS